MESAPWLNDVCVFLGVAGMIVPLFQRARISAVLGFILAGIAIGPFGLGRLAVDYPWTRYFTIEQRSAIEPFGELGVMFLLFLIGIELSLPRLWSMRRYVLGVGAVQVGATMVAIGGVLFLLGLGAEAAVILAMALALSSTAIVMQLLQEQGRTATTLGRVALSVLLFQDLMVSPVLFVTGVLGPSQGSVAIRFAFALAQAAAVVALIAVAGRFVLRPLLRFAGRTGSRDLIMAITILIVLTVAAATAAAGLSVALGAFLAGLLLGETEFGEQIEVDLEPFKGLLLGLFFTTVGMSIDLAEVAMSVHWLLLASAGLVLLKAIILFAAARAFGVTVSTAAELALLLPQASEFAFVVVGLAGASALLEPRLASFTLACVSLTMLATPALAVAALRVGQALQRMDHGEGPSDAEVRDLEGHVVIGGFGRVGQIVASLLEAEKIPFVALDTDGALATRERKAGRYVFFGDAARPEMLDRAGVARAGAVVVTLDAPRAAERMVENARRRNPNVIIVARATDRAHAARLLARGAIGVIPEAVEASLQLAGRLLEALDIPQEAVQRRLAQAREAERERLVEAAADEK